MKTMKTLLRDYSKNTDGNFAIMTAFCAMTLLTVVGVAVDVSGMTSLRKTMQDRLDVAVLAAASSGETKDAELKKIVKDVIEQGSNNTWEMDAVITIEDEEIYAEGTTIYDPMIMGIMNQGKIRVKVNSAAPVATEVPMNISMVLDTTGSMAGSNMADLKDAAEVLVDFVEAQKHPQSRIAVVPFSNYVNIGMSRRNESWMDVPADATTGPAPACYPEESWTGSGCTTTTETRYSDGVSFTATRTTCSSNTATPTGNTICPPAPSIAWNGCAGSRNAPDNIIADASSANPIAGAMNVNCGEEILPMTSDYNAVRTKINALKANGPTYLPTGVIWGWRTLTPNAPFTEAASSPDNAIRALVLMTDGVNIMTQEARGGSTDEIYHRTYDMTDNASDKEATERLLEICDGVKADDIALFTIAYKLPGGSKKTEKTLEECATSASFAFEAKNRDQLKKAFDAIGKNLKTVRLSK